MLEREREQHSSDVRENKIGSCQSHTHVLHHTRPQLLHTHHDLLLNFIFSNLKPIQYLQKTMRFPQYSD